MSTTADYSFLNSLDVSTLEHLLSTHPDTASLLPQSTLGMDEAEADKARKEAKRRKFRDLTIPVPQNPARRLKAEEDPELWLRTYFGDRFTEEFTQDRRDMLDSIIAAAMYGGDQAIAGPRGEGKTSLAMCGALNLVCRRLCRFPIVIGKSQGKSQQELKDIKERLQGDGLFKQDYPEIAVPFAAVGGWSSRARMQTVAGVNTNLVLAADHIAFPTISRSQLPKHWPSEITPASNGQVIYCLGIDGPIRGTKFRGMRPELVIIDDIEDREAAASETLIAKNEEIIEQDIAGLGASAERVARAMLCTIQNRKCIAYKYTDAKQKPSWKGKRYRKMVKPPDRMDLVQQYIEQRQLKSENDPDAREAFRFWRDNQAEIERGCIVSNPQSYTNKLHADGEPLELSAIQAYYNRVADWGEKAVATEIDNDPPEEVGPQGMGLTAEIVSSRLSGLARKQVPANAELLTAGIDIGKYNCHWVVCAWWRGAGGVVVDYGVQEVTGNENVRLQDRAADMEASEPAIYRALLAWRDYLLDSEFVDAAGQRRKVDMVLCDSGTYTNAVYEFCRQVRGIFRPSKGIAGYKPRAKSNATCAAGANQHAQWLESSGVWLQELDTDYWKQWVHERFLTPTFDENNMLRRGSLSLYQPEGSKRHLSYSQHIVAEELTTEFKEGKGTKTAWVAKNPNNHWLDATYLAAACTEALGIRLITPSEMPITPTQSPAKPVKPIRPRTQHGQRFKHRPGGWIPKRR